MGECTYRRIKSIMIRYTGLKINIDHTEEDIRRALSKKLRLRNVNIQNFVIRKKSLDARDKNAIHWNYIIDLATDNDKEVLRLNKGRKEFSRPTPKKYRPPLQGQTLYDVNEHGRICVIGSGPAGLFCAYMLSEAGFMPLLIERGEPVEKRLKTVDDFWSGKTPLNINSNVQFGEGGAGTFSDGKLNTGVNDAEGRNDKVLSVFVENGAAPNIMYDSKAHLGTDELSKIVSNMRNKIIANGGEVLFNTHFISFKENDGKLESIKVKDLEDDSFMDIPCTNLVLAIGHSARDTFSYLINETTLQIEAKPFAVGIRVQHLQDDINKAQYGDGYAELYDGKLPPADYKLVYHNANKDSIYSFCMCPGGYVVDSSSENNRLCINGLSYSGRDGKNANSAIVMAVKPSEDPSENIKFQIGLEEKTYMIGKGKIPLQKFSDFENNSITSSFGKVLPEMKGEYSFADLNDIFDKYFCESVKEAIHEFGKRIKGYDDPDILLSAVESRTSSPVRIKRDAYFESAVKGVFPCGEGAGYAGGITSAAMDGIKVFEEINRRYFTSVLK